MVDVSRNKHLTKLYIKCPLHLKYVLATNTTGSNCFSNIVKRHIIFALHTLKSIGLRSGELGGQSAGGNQASLNCSSSATVFGTIWWGTVLLKDEKLACRCRTDVIKCVSGASLSYHDLGCRRTETTHQERVGRSESRYYWTCSWRVAPASARLRSHLTEADISSICKDDVTYYTFDNFWETTTASRICRYSMIH